VATSFQCLQDEIVGCEKCPNLRRYGQEIAIAKRKAYAEWDYWGRPVPNFGPARSRLVIVGLAPGAHGAHRTGRMFTGDRSGDWLYAALYRQGFASQPDSYAIDDGLKLKNCLITAVNHCAPPDNKPTRDEQLNCQPYLERLLRFAPRDVIVCLGKIAWDGAFRAFRALGWWEASRPAFGHGAEVELQQGRICLGCYHPSQQNTFTGKLTEKMLDQVFARAKDRLG
jgi:uracil-DNA glycosylase family 4